MFDLLMQTPTPDIYTGFIIAVATLVSAVSGLIVHYVNQPKIKAIGQLAKANADTVIENKQNIATMAKVTYDMLPEQSQKIVDQPTVRIASLEAKLEAVTKQLNDLSANVKV